MTFLLGEMSVHSVSAYENICMSFRYLFFKYFGRLLKTWRLVPVTLRLRRSVLGPRTFIFNQFTVGLGLEIS